MNKSWQQIIKETHVGYCGSIDSYPELIKENPVIEVDLKYFERVIKEACDGGQAGYDCFPDEGGINIAAALLAEVKRLREMK